MKNDTKLIMESWRSFLEDLDNQENLNESWVKNSALALGVLLSSISPTKQSHAKVKGVSTEDTSYVAKEFLRKKSHPVLESLLKKIADENMQTLTEHEAKILRLILESKKELRKSLIGDAKALLKKHKDGKIKLNRNIIDNSDVMYDTDAELKEIESQIQDIYNTIDIIDKQYEVSYFKSGSSTYFKIKSKDSGKTVFSQQTN